MGEVSKEIRQRANAPLCARSLGTPGGHVLLADQTRR